MILNKDELKTLKSEIENQLSKRQKSTEQSEQHDSKALHIADVRERFSDKYKKKLITKFMNQYGDDVMAREKANSFAVGFSKAWDIMLNEL